MLRGGFFHGFPHLVAPFSAINTISIPEATESSAGLMSAADKLKLNSLRPFKNIFTKISWGTGNAGPVLMGTQSAGKYTVYDVYTSDYSSDVGYSPVGGYSKLSGNGKWKYPVTIHTSDPYENAKTYSGGIWEISSSNYSRITITSENLDTGESSLTTVNANSDLNNLVLRFHMISRVYFYTGQTESQNRLLKMDELPIIEFRFDTLHSGTWTTNMPIWTYEGVGTTLDASYLLFHSIEYP